MLIIGTPAPVHDALALECPRVHSPAEGFDTLTERLWVPYSPFFTKGTLRRDKRGLGNFYVADESPIGFLAGRPIIELTSRGIADPTETKPYKTALRESAIVDADSDYSPTWWKPDHTRVIVWWVSPTKPEAGSLVSFPAIPPERYGLPEIYWRRRNTALDIDNPGWRGEGWLLENRDADTLPGSEITLVQDTYLYDYFVPDFPSGSRDDL